MGQKEIEMRDYVHMPINGKQVKHDMFDLIVFRNAMYHEVDNKLQQIKKHIDKYNTLTQQIEALELQRTEALNNVEKLNFEIDAYYPEKRQ